jgi:hypothetical protein
MLESVAETLCSLRCMLKTPHRGPIHEALLLLPQVYASKSAPLVAAMHELVRIMRTITGSMPPPRSVPPGSKPESACAGAAAAAAAAGAHDSPCCSGSVQYPAPSSGCEAHSNEESGSFVSHDSCSDGQPGGSSMHAQQQQQPHCDGSDQQPALTLEDADRLESLLRELLHNIMRMREVHRYAAPPAHSTSLPVWCCGRDGTCML